MKIGISSPSFALAPFTKTLDEVARHFSHWELVADLKQLLPDIAYQMKELAPSYDLEYSIHAPFNDLNLAALNPELRKLAIRYLKETISSASELGIELITFHPGHLCPSGVYALDMVYQENLKSLREIGEFIENDGLKITLALENMPLRNWTLGNTTEEILEMVDATPFGICFDVGHAFIVDNQDGIKKFLNNISKFKNVHIHDNNGKRDEHLILGEGKIDIPLVVEHLKKEYNGPIIIESNDLIEGIRSREYLEKLL